jgi:thioredoxin 1
VNVHFYDVKSLFGRPYAEKYRVQFIPTQVFLDNNGEEYYRHVGFFPKDEIVKILQLRGIK